MLSRDDIKYMKGVLEMNKQIVEVERLRRITGYLTSDIKFWNDGKKAELKDRVKHIKGVK